MWTQVAYPKLMFIRQKTSYKDNRKKNRVGSSKKTQDERGKKKGQKIVKITLDASVIKVTKNKSYANTLKSVKKGLNDADLVGEVEIMGR